MKRFEVEVVRRTIIVVPEESHTFQDLLEQGIEQIDREHMTQSNTQLFVTPVDFEGNPTNKKAEIKVSDRYQ
jgi:hypothetical protein